MGNGGFAGQIDRATLAAAALRGDAAAATDTGHCGDRHEAGWAVGRPDLVEDYAWRSIGIASDVARAAIRLFYGRDARRHYAMGCSYGGRQALVAAGRWPDDWDGVVAGAPAVRWIERLAAMVRTGTAVRAPGAGLSADGIAAARADCSTLTPAQAAAVTAVEAAGYPLGHADPAEWARWIFTATAPSHASLGEQLRHLSDTDGFALPDLSAFAAKGGRVLSYFGLADAVLPPAHAVADALAVGARDDFYRLFLIPGMGHCQGGALPHAIGQSLAAPAPANDPTHDVRRALEAWVEDGVAPDRLVACLPDDPGRTATLTPVTFGR